MVPGTAHRPFPTVSYEALVEKIGIFKFFIRSNGSLNRNLNNDLMLNVGKVLLFMGLQLLLFVVDVYVFCCEKGFFQKGAGVQGSAGVFQCFYGI